jgi:hypothetical protein
MVLYSWKSPYSRAFQLEALKSSFPELYVSYGYI